jgi:hypothetical protein
MRDGAAALTHHISKEMNELNLERCKCVPTNTPGADWRCLEALVRDDPSREKFKVKLPTEGSPYAACIAYETVVARAVASCRPSKLMLWSCYLVSVAECFGASLCSCVWGLTATAAAPLQGQPLVPWCLPNTAERHNGWRGLFGRLDWQGHFPTSTTDPQPMGKVTAGQQHACPTSSGSARAAWLARQGAAAVDRA